MVDTKMTGLECAPHVYYLVEELSAIEDAGHMKNRKVKAIGYIEKDPRGFRLKDSVDSEIFVRLDLKYVEKDVIDIHPCLIFGLLCTINKTPVVTVKSIRKLDSNAEHLDIYRQQCMILRDRYKDFHAF